MSIETNSSSWKQLNSQIADLFQQGKYHDAITLSERCVNLAEQSNNDFQLQVALNNLATSYKSLGNYLNAEKIFLKVLEQKVSTLGKDNPSTATTLNNLAEVYVSQGRYDQAEMLYRQALEIIEKSLGTEHPNLATVYNNLATLYMTQGRVLDAEKFYLRDLNISESALGPNHPNVASTLNNLAGLYATTGNLDKAEANYQRALTIMRSSLGEMHPHLLTTYQNLANLYESEGKYEIAKNLYILAAKVQQNLFGENSQTKLLREKVKSLETKIEELSDKDKKADRIINQWAMASAIAKGVGPTTDTLALIGVWAKMLTEIAEVYEVDFDRSEFEKAAKNSLKSLGLYNAGSILASAITSILGVSPVWSFLANSTLSASLTRNLGKNYKDSWRSGKSPENITSILSESLQDIKEAA